MSVHVRRPPEVAIPASDAPAESVAWASAGIAALVVAGGCLVATALLGPSAAEAPLGRHDDGATPPWHFDAAPPAWLVTTLLAAAVAAGAVLVAVVLSGRWRPDGRRLAVAGLGVAAALAVLPPIASADPLSYAAYGHMVTTGHDPWTTKPSTLAPHDPVAAAVESPWQDEPAVYGPLATGEQALASLVAGDDVARTVLLLDLVGGGAFVLVGWLLVRGALDDDIRRRRAVLWAANPLLWLQLVAGAHLDVLVAAAAVAAVAVGRRRPVPGAALAGVAGLLKPPGGLVWLALAWAARRRRRTLAALAATAAVVVVPAYAAAGSGALRELSRASRRVSKATPWRPVVTWTHLDRSVVGTLALLLAAGLVLLLLRRADTRDTTLVAGAITLGYVLAAPYALPWYDALPWALLALATASWRDGLLLVHTTVLSLAYLPGRDAFPLQGSLATVTRTMRSDVAPVLLTALLLALVVLAVSGRSGPAASAGSRPTP